MADELRQHCEKISKLLLRNRMTENICRQRLIYLQQLMQCVAIIFEHGSSNLLVKPSTISHLSKELMLHNDTAFDTCRQRLISNHKSLLKLFYHFTDVSVTSTT